MSTMRTLDVYLVDDAANIRERLVALINTLPGARVVGSAARADVATREILALEPDVVILDIALAHGNGFDVLRAVHAAAPQIEMYVLSNSASAQYRRRAADLGASDLFDKSLEFESVRDTLKRRAASNAGVQLRP